MAPAFTLSSFCRTTSVSVRSNIRSLAPFRGGKITVTDRQVRGEDRYPSVPFPFTLSAARDPTLFAPSEGSPHVSLRWRSSTIRGSGSPKKPLACAECIDQVGCRNLQLRDTNYTRYQATPFPRMWVAMTDLPGALRPRDHWTVWDCGLAHFLNLQTQTLQDYARVIRQVT